MILRRSRRFLCLLICLALPPTTLCSQTETQSPSSSSTKHVKKPAASTESGIDNGTVTNGVYRNKTLAFSCKIPEGWVLRTEEMNGREEKKADDPKEEKGTKDSAAPQPAASSAGAKVLLAAFSRPPEARAEDVNAS